MVAGASERIVSIDFVRRGTFLLAIATVHGEEPLVIGSIVYGPAAAHEAVFAKFAVAMQEVVSTFMRDTHGEGEAVWLDDSDRKLSS